MSQPLPQPHCEYFEAGVCRSCSLIETPSADQLARKQERCVALLPTVPSVAWMPAVAGGERDFRNRAKLVVGGSAGAVTLGILGPDGAGADLRECLIHAPAIRSAIPAIAETLNATGLAPYDVGRRRGDMKFVHVTVSPADRLMVRFVVRTVSAGHAINARLAGLRTRVPAIDVASINLLPEHRAVLEGDEEHMLVGSSLPMDLDRVTLHLLPRSFFQTNTTVAKALYAQAAEWIDEIDPGSLWDLYCGVGGFALHCAQQWGTDSSSDSSHSAARRVVGVEVSEQAIRSAKRSARDAGLAARFVAADATRFVLDTTPEDAPDTVIVNPPRRGIGDDFAGWLNGANGVRNVIYSSCNPESLARDLAAMPRFQVRTARLFDMFPHTEHLEVMVLLERI